MKKHIYKLLWLICLSSLPFILSLRGDFVFDDSEAILKNKNVFLGSWADCFYNDFWGTNITSNLSHKSYRPLTILSFRLNYILSGEKLNGTHFKITNLFCHVMCCILIWIAFNKIVREIRFNSKCQMDISYLSAILFAVHPVHVEAVCGIVGRADMLAGATFFISLLFYIKVTTTPRLIAAICYLIGAIVFASISMLFKENGITVLGFCILYELVTHFDQQKIRKKYKEDTNHSKQAYLSKPTKIIILVIAITVLLYLRWFIMGGTKPEFKSTDNPAAFTNNFLTKIATYNYIYFINFLLLIWPQWLCYDWSMGCIPLIETIKDYRIPFIIFIDCYAILFVIAIVRNKNVVLKKILVLAVSLSIIPFLPAANIFYPVGFVIAERILYIPSAGYCFLMAIGVHLVVNITKRYKTVLGSYYFLILILALKSYQRSFDWQNEYALFTSGLSVCPLNAKVHYNVAKVADARHDIEWALLEYKQAIRLYPEYYQAMNNLANLLKNQKQYDEAEFYLRNAIKHKRDFPAAWMNLGIVLANKKRYKDSEIAYKTALEYRHKYPDCFYNLGNLYLELNKTQEAIDSWSQAININQSHKLAWTNLLALLDNTEQTERALQIVPKALAEVGDSPSINFAIANLYGKINRYEEAEIYFRKSIALFGNRVQAIHYTNLGVLYHRWKKYSLAKEMYRNALSIDPSFKSAQNNLKKLRSKIKQTH